ncbi:MAG TPA: DUF3084 domain-containing protein [Chthonomonadaceae bacterium]|nr:DUF3084 domain-containing protein [Chthonomonadaceae bacterium]
MFWTIVALIFLMALGGFVSYYGDLQGRRWGKKRVSWFGLRPKHTAILITILTGSAIVVLSTVVIMAAVPNIRDVILSGEHAIRDNKRILAQNQQDKTASASQLDAVNHTLAIRSHDLEAKNQELAKVTPLLATLQQQQQQLIKQNQLLQQQNSQLTATIKRDRAAHEALTQENRKEAIWNKNAEQINKDLADQNISLTRDNIEKTRTSTDLQQKNDTLTHDNIGLTKQNDRVRAENEAIYNKSKSLELEMMAKTQQLSALRQQLDDLARQRDEDLRVYGQVTGENQNILQNYAMLKRARMNIRADSELARLTIAPHLRPEAVRNQLLQLLMNASDTARKLGASPDISGREARIVPKQLITVTGVQKVNEQASLDALADNLSGRDKPVVVLALTLSNSVVGEPVAVELQPYQIDRVYDRAEKVAERHIDARQPVDKIIENLIQFLQKDVRDAAIKAGALPRIDPETGMPEIGVIGTAELFQLTDRVRRMGGDVILTATAKHDVSSADPLNLEFKVTRVSDKPEALTEKRITAFRSAGP